MLKAMKTPATRQCAELLWREVGSNPVLDVLLVAKFGSLTRRDFSCDLNHKMAASAVICFYLHARRARPCHFVCDPEWRVGVYSPITTRAVLTAAVSACHSRNAVDGRSAATRGRVGYWP